MLYTFVVMNIQFLYPGFLWALASLAIPVLIHLFHFRRYRTVYFSNLEMLRTVSKDNRPRTRLRHLLVLLARLLALAAIVLAFAQPYIPVGGELQRGELGHVGLYIDNSFSMEAENAQGELLEQAKNAAYRVAGTYKRGTRFYLITNDYEPQHTQAVEISKLSDMIARVEASPVGRKAGSVALYYASLPQPKGAARNLFVFSDFQKGMANVEKTSLNDNMLMHLVPFPNQGVANMYADSCWFATPGRKRGQPEELTVLVHNRSQEDYQEIPLKLYLDDILKAIASFNIQAGGSEYITLNYTTTKTGVIQGRVEISDYPLTYDNTLYFSYMLSARTRVLDLRPDDKPRVPEAMFDGDELTTYNSAHVEKVDYSKLNNYHFIILNEARSVSSGLADLLKQYVESGGSLLIVPSGDIEDNYTALFGRFGLSPFGEKDTTPQPLAGIEYQDEIYAQAFRKQSERPDLPSIGMSYTCSPARGERSLLAFEGGRPALTVLRAGRGKCYRFMMPLSHPDNMLARHMIIAPTLYNMALMSQTSGQLYYTIGQDDGLVLENVQARDEGPVKIKAAKGGGEFIPRMQSASGNMILYTESKPEKAGNYLALQGGDTLAGLAFNYGRGESLMDFAGEKELKAKIKENPKSAQISMHMPEEGKLSLSLENLERGEALWRYLVLLALLMLAVEVALLRLWRN